MAASSPDPPPEAPVKREMKVLSLGLPRTGTASMAAALTLLGYENVYHGLKALSSPHDWALLERAADASFANLPSHATAPSFTRADWDELFGGCEATTDVASVFARQLIDAYPDAKVVLVPRDFDAWYRSIDATVLQALWNPAADVLIRLVEPLVGSRAGLAVRKLMLGLFAAADVAGCRANARAAFERHYADVKALVPPERLLVYELGSGWGPLCEFLGRPVPDAPFPRLNEAAELKRVTHEKMTALFRDVAAMVAPWAAAAAVAGIGAWWMLA